MFKGLRVSWSVPVLVSAFLLTSSPALASSSAGAASANSANSQLYQAPQAPGLIFESAVIGPPSGDGALVTDYQYLGARFTVSAPTQLSSVGGRMRGDGTLFAAVVRLSDPTAVPSGSPFTATVAVALITPPPAAAEDVTVPMNVVLQPGPYALVFGTGRFGAAGFGVMPFNNLDLPGASYFHWRGDPMVWVDGGMTGVRFFAAGDVAADVTSPTITAAPDRSANADGWYNAPVAISFSCEDASGIASCSAPVTLSGEGAAQSATGTAIDNAGNSASTSVTGINIDLTSPVVTFTGNAATYSVDQTLLITCVASDALSGIATTSCPSGASGPATNYVGTTATTTTTLTATASDKAGNSVSATTTFTVIVTPDGICRLSASLKAAEDICTKVNAIAVAPNARSKAGALAAFDNFLTAQEGKSIPDDLARLLSRLAHLL